MRLQMTHDSVSATSRNKTPCTLAQFCVIPPLGRNMVARTIHVPAASRIPGTMSVYTQGLDGDRNPA